MRGRWGFFVCGRNPKTMIAKDLSKKTRKVTIGLSDDERQELEILFDRLMVQDPNGQSLQPYLQSLRAVLRGRDKLTAALLEKLSKNPSPAGYKAFLELAGLIEAKDFKKIARQAGYRFREKGFADARRPSAAPQVVLIPKEARRAVAHMVPALDIDWFIAGLFPSEVGGDPLAVTAYSENRFSQLTVRVVESSQNAYREFIEKLGEHLPNQAPYEVPPWHAARVYFEMLEFHGDRLISPQAERAKRILKPFHDLRKKPFAYDLLPAPEQIDWQVSDQTLAELFENIPSSPILLSREALLPHYDKMSQLLRSVLVVRQEIQQERAAELLGQAADELITGPSRFYYERLFEEFAVALKSAKKNALSQIAWRVAQHLAGSSRAGEHPVLTEIVAFSLRSHWPGEFAHEEEAVQEPFDTTGAGLIIPR
jgi:hypothetical protein